MTVCWSGSLLYTYKKNPLILPIFLHKNTKSCITLLAFSDSESPSSIVYPRRTTFTLVLYLGKTRQWARIWTKYYCDDIFSTVLSFFKRVSTVVCTFDVTNDVIYMRWRCITFLSSTMGAGGARGTKMKNNRKTQWIWYQNVPYGPIKKTSTNTLCFCSFIRKLQTFEFPRWTRGRGFSKWRSFNSFSSEQLMYYYLGKKISCHIT